MTADESIVTCHAGGEQIVVLADKDFRDVLNSAVGIDLDQAKARLFDCDTGNRIRQ